MKKYLLAFALLAATPAHADTVTITFTGTVSTEDFNGITGIDYFGYFGIPGASLFGAPFTVVHVVDAPPGSTSAPVTMSSITINGVTHTFDNVGGQYSSYYAVTAPSRDTGI